ncbi:caspase family protein [Peribacillus simplex]|uniref:caspase family protein n=1 Tax=Peribacillus simplex TaxID=1478 RepID=UPI0024C17CCA|nr:caspase family protein [Peribacillus simplex]WHY54317.1 caspase family protein [Peribacillus simplex]
MNIAILIGVSEYTHQPNLPACANDVRIMKHFLTSTGKYKKILLLDKDTTSKNVKDKIINFLSEIEQSEEPVDEIFYYFSGHGTYDNDEFYYVMSDFQNANKKRTSLENTELDNLLRNLDANLVVKIVDACQSGVPYVKDVDDNHFDKILRYEQKVFKNCYFMFSSQSDQKSYAGDELSSFTDGIFSAILESDDDTPLRYKEIMDSISDSFAKNTEFNGREQKPFFIVQASYTDEFCFVTKDIKKELDTIISEIIVPEELPTTKDTMSIKQMLEEDAKKYCVSLEEIEEQVIKIKTYIKEYTFSNELDDIYTLERNFYEKDVDIPEVEKIATTLEKLSNGYYIDVEYGKKEMKEVVSNFASLSATLRGEKPKYRSVEKMVPVNYRTTINLPFYLAELKATTKLPNLTPFDVKVVPIVSRSKILLFFSYNSYKEEYFDEYVLANRVKWHEVEIEIKNETEIKEQIGIILESMKGRIMKFINNKFNVNLESESDVNTKNDVAIINAAINA